MNKLYNIFIFLSTFIRNILEIYSCIYLYQKGLSFREILLFYILVYLIGIILNIMIYFISRKVSINYLLIISIIFSIITYYLFHKSNNYLLLGILLSVSMFTYHPVRHIYGVYSLNNKVDIGNNLIFMYIAIILSNYFVMKRINILVIILLSFLSIIPLFFINKKMYNSQMSLIKKDKVIFFVKDQGRVLFMLFEPLFLYLYINNSIRYVGLFNVIVSIASIIYMIFIIRYVNVDKYFKFINIFLVFVLILKLNINNKVFLYVIAFFEGLCFKTSELYSTNILYNTVDEPIGYIVMSQIIFLVARIVLLIISYFIGDIKIMLYMFVFIIFLISLKKDTIGVSL